MIHDDDVAKGVIDARTFARWEGMVAAFFELEFDPVGEVVDRQCVIDEIGTQFDDFLAHVFGKEANLAVGSALADFFDDGKALGLLAGCAGEVAVDRCRIGNRVVLLARTPSGQGLPIHFGEPALNVDSSDKAVGNGVLSECLGHEADERASDLGRLNRQLAILAQGKRFFGAIGRE